MPVSSLFLPLKIPVRHDLVQPLGEWLDLDEQVSTFDHDDDDDDDDLAWIVPKPSFKSYECRDELLRLAALRNSLSENLQDSHQMCLESRSLEDLMEYHATLLEFEKRGFPTVDKESNGIALTWKGAFAGRQEETHYSLLYDRACTIWNISALQSFMSATADMTTKEGCKISISQSQTAASNLAVLRQLVEGGDYSTVDLSPSMISFWEKMLLAQGQLSIYRLANLGTVRQHTTLAYLVQAAAGFYNEALGHAQGPRLQSECPKQSKEWAVHCKNQSLICQSRAVFHMGIEHRLKLEYGEEIARLRQCVKTLKETQNFVKTTEVQMQLQEVEGLVKMARDRLVHAEEDNHNVYMANIPNDSDLPEIKQQTMVKQNLPLAPPMMVTQFPMFAFL